MQDAKGKRQGIDYSAIKLSEADIADGKYKRRIGSGIAWENRGAFQLVLLRHAGLLPHHKLLDYGCGPARGGVHLIRYLDPGSYTGLDINPDYIKAAQQVIDDQRLADRRPVFALTSDYRDTRQFDFCLLFSVLNHCTPDEISAFFRFIEARLTPDGAIYVTHARSVAPQDYEPALKCSRTFTPMDFNIEEYGWRSPDEIFPIIELRLR